MKKSIIALAVIASSGAMAKTPQIEGLSVSPEKPTPVFYGQLHGRIQQEGDKDSNVELGWAEIGAKGIHAIPSKGIKVIYSFEAAYTEDNEWDKNEDGNSSDIFITDASFKTNTKYGTVWLGYGKTGVFTNVMDRMNIFTDADMKKNLTGDLYEQGYSGGGTVGYFSPSFNKFHFAMGYFTASEYDGDNTDGFNIRGMYHGGNFNAILSHTEFSGESLNAGNNPNFDPDTFTGSTETFTRDHIGVDYTFGDFTIAAVYEQNKKIANAVTPDNQVLGIAAQYDLSDYEFKLGYQTKSYDQTTVTAGPNTLQFEDQSAVLANITYKFDKHFSFYVETTQFLEDTDYSTVPMVDNVEDSVSAGLVFNF